MKKLESSFKNMVIVLTGVTVIAGALLGYVNQVTAEPIAQANTKALNEALAVVLPEGYDNNPSEATEVVELEGAQYTIYKAMKGDELIGAAVESVSGGFGGDLKVLVGFDQEGNIKDYSVLSHSETPGLGSKSTEWFKKGAKGDITGMNPGNGALIVSKDGGQVDAITASTITSRAFLKAVNNAYAAFAALQGQSVDVQSGATQQAEAAEAAAEEGAEEAAEAADAAAENVEQN